MSGNNEIGGSLIAFGKKERKISEVKAQRLMFTSGHELHRGRTDGRTAAVGPIKISVGAFTEREAGGR